MKKKKVKLNYKNITKLAVILFLIIGIIIGINIIKYHNSDEYKLKVIGYSKEQIKEIKKLDTKYKDKVLSIDYNDFLLLLFKEKYFMFDNTDRYIEYHKNNEEKSATDVVAIVNVNEDHEHYTNTTKTDTSKGNLILVNKYNYLDKDYEPENLYNVKNWYGFGENTIIEEVYDAFIDMHKAAKKEDLSILITSGFRTYKLQEELYEEYQDYYGEEETDRIAARPGFSEHQTGLCIDVMNYTSTMEDFESTDEFKWMQKNAYKYGFILRYPKGKEYITGYDYESWHYRYVGKEVAEEINKLGITFDEYYAYYVK